MRKSLTRKLDVSSYWDIFDRDIEVADVGCSSRISLFVNFIQTPIVVDGGLIPHTSTKLSSLIKLCNFKSFTSRCGNE
jgi:hypothetical protein